MRRWTAVLFGAVLLSCARVAASDEPEAEPASSDVARAREAFVEGTEHARLARWAEALSSFERAERLRPHAITTYNIGACLRALGLYVRARHALARALDEHAASGNVALPDALVDQAQALLGQIDGLLVRMTLAVAPPGAALSIDGRPLARDDRATGAHPVYFAGLRSPAAPEPVAAPTVVVMLDPGAHVITLSREGFAPAVVNQSFAPGAAVEIGLELNRLPATVRVRSHPTGAIVTVDAKDVGPTPVDVRRAPGSHRIEVRQDDFEPFESEVSLQPGEQLDVYARLVERKPSVLEQWWFWTIAGAVVATAAVVTYAATRTDPEPTREPLSGGTFGYVVRIP